MSERRDTEGKAQKIAIGATVGGVLLIVFLAVILIIQFVQIGVGNSRKKELEDQIVEYEQQIEQGEKNLDWYRTGSGLYWYARTYGFT